MNQTGEEGGDRKRVAMEEDAREAVEDPADMSYSELMKTLNSLSKRMKEDKNSSMQPQQQSSSRSAPITTPFSSSSQDFNAANQALLCDSLDSLITHYLTKYLSGTAEDRLMKSDLENVRSYMRRRKSKKQEEMKRNEVNRSTARRFIMNGIRSSVKSQASTGRSTDDQEEVNKPDDHKKLKLDQSLNNPLPEIRKVIKNQHHAEDEDEDDDNLKIYDD